MYVSSSPYPESGGSFGGDQLSRQPLLTNSDYLQNKSCITCEPTATSASSNAVKAFALLNENPQAQVLKNIVPFMQFFLPILGYIIMK